MLERLLRPKSALVLLLLVQVVLATLAAGKAWTGRTDDPELPGALSGASASLRPLTIESAMPLAQEQAAKWLPDAYLLTVNMEIDWPFNEPESTVTSLPPGGWVTVTFVAPWRHDEAEAATLGVFFDRGSGQMYGQWQTEWSEAPAPMIAMPKSGVDSATAVLAAELAGGTEFRAECPRVRSRTRVNLTSEPDDQVAGQTTLVWLITYMDNRNQPLGYQVVVDVASGSILRKEYDPVLCDN